MANELTEHLQFHGQSRSTGCLQVTTQFETASVFLMDGELAYAEAGRHRGLCALFWAMTWEEAVVAWHVQATPPVVQTRQAVDELLFQFAQLEDAAQTDEATLAQIYGGDEANRDAIKMMDLSKYQISFQVLNTDFKGFVFYLQNDITSVGRAEDCDVMLPDSSISGHHCKIIKEQHCIRVVDLGSTNGTFINNTMVDDQILQPGDEFKIGTVVVALQLRIKRRLNEAAVAANNQAVQRTVKQTQSVGATTMKLDPSKLVKAKARISGPITWRNLTGEPQKTKSNSLLAKMFKR